MILKHCETCNQMTNHKGNRCLKHYSKPFDYKLNKSIEGISKVMTEKYNKCNCKACNPKIKIKHILIPHGYNWRKCQKTHLWIKGKGVMQFIEIEFVELVGKWGKCEK